MEIRCKALHAFTVILFFFMAMGAFIGSFEECIPMVPIVVALAISLGWDKLTGLGMSLLAVGCGFASGVCNPLRSALRRDLPDCQCFPAHGCAPSASC